MIFFIWNANKWTNTQKKTMLCELVLQTPFAYLLICIVFCVHCFLQFSRCMRNVHSRKFIFMLNEWFELAIYFMQLAYGINMIFLYSRQTWSSTFLTRSFGCKLKFARKFHIFFKKFVPRIADNHNLFLTISIDFVLEFFYEIYAILFPIVFFFYFFVYNFRELSVHTFYFYFYLSPRWTWIYINWQAVVLNTNSFYWNWLEWEPSMAWIFEMS